MTRRQQAKASRSAERNEIVVFDGPDTLAIVQAARSAILLDIEKAGGLQAVRRQRASQAKSAISSKDQT